MYTDGHSLALHDALPSSVQPGDGGGDLAGPSPRVAAVSPRRRLHRAFQAAIEALAPQLPDRLKQALESWEHARGSCVRRSDLAVGAGILFVGGRSEEHTSELQSLMSISYAVFCLKKHNTISNNKPNN